MSALANLYRIATKSLRRLGDAAFRRRLANMHRAVAAMGAEQRLGYIDVCRDLLRAIGAQGMTHPDECLLLMRLASQVHHGVIVEIGSYRGRSTIALATGSARGASTRVYAVEPHDDFTGVLGARFGPPDKVAFQRNIARAGVSPLVHLISATSQAAAQNWDATIGLLWIDGNHRYEAVKQDFELWSPFLHEHGRIAFDDSTVEGLGPHTLIEEILSNGSFERLQIVGKVTVIGRRAAK